MLFCGNLQLVMYRYIGIRLGNGIDKSLFTATFVLADELKEIFWSGEATRALIESVHEHYADLRSKNVKKRPIWEKIKSSIDNFHVSVATFYK